MTVPSDNTILYLSRKDVEGICQEIDSVAVMREVFCLHGAGEMILPDEAYLGWTNALDENARSLNMPSYVGGQFRVAGTKIINGNPWNPARGQPRANGLTLLFDITSARIICVMEGAYLSSLRTASVTALATDVLASKEITCLAVIGAGVLARAHIDLLGRRLPHLRQIRIFDLDTQRVDALQREFAPVLQAYGVSLQATPSAEDSIHGAQLIVPVTTTTSHYIRFAWLEPGSLLVNVSLDDAYPEVVLQAHRLIVDDWNLVKSDTRRLVGRMYREGSILDPDSQVEDIAARRRRIDAQLGEIICGVKEGRRHADEIIVVNPFGMSIEDVALAGQVYHLARERGIGLSLEQ